ncbi:hypothetical protein [Corynebacterium flavescens]|uniref:hypothetical protein n=1 Tax=Corynebacterium flavescens TaxID=28028 RepID=UPI0011435F11|nr:hypothetical protein [Corynebacterium flavescens]KAA8720460.1 hypothetical protein F4V60_09160 [Corynebacterium flavescens]
MSFELNGVCWDGMIDSAETGKKSDGTAYVQGHMISDHKHFGRMLGRGPIVSAADGSSEVEKGRLGEITARLVSRGAVRTGLPCYVLIDDPGDYVEIEVRTEDYVRDLLADPLSGSNSFVQVRKLRPGQPLPGAGKLLHYAGVMERQWEQSQLDAGMWPNATTSPRIDGAALVDDTPVLPDNSWGGEGLVDFEGAVLTEPLRGVCWIPFETVVERPVGYFDDVDPEIVHVATREQIKAGYGAKNGRPHYVTFFKPGALSSTTAPKLVQCAEAGLLRSMAGEALTEQQAYSRIGSGAAYAWKSGATWIIATQSEFEQDSQKYLPRGDQQKQTPGILVWQHAGRDRRGIVFSSSPGGGLEAWSTTETAPDGAMLIAGGQMDAQTIAALESGVLQPSGTVENVDESTASAVLPSGAGLPGAVEQLDVDVQPNATISGTGVSFSKAGGRIDIAQAGPFFLREKYMSLGSSGGANPVSEVAREWAKSQGSTSMSFTPGNHQAVVFGDDVALPNGRVVPGWKPGDRVSFVDGNTRVSEVIMGFSLKASPEEPLTVEPIMGRVVNGVLANLQQRLEKAENTGTKAILAPDQKVPKEEVKAIADDSASVVNKSLIEVSKDLSERISKTVADADFSEYDAKLQASLWGEQGEFNRINVEFQEQQKAIDAAQDRALALSKETIEMHESWITQMQDTMEKLQKTQTQILMLDYSESSVENEWLKLMRSGNRVSWEVKQGWTGTLVLLAAIDPQKPPVYGQYVYLTKLKIPNPEYLFLDSSQGIGSFQATITANPGVPKTVTPTIDDQTVGNDWTTLTSWTLPKDAEVMLSTQLWWQNKSFLDSYDLRVTVNGQDATSSASQEGAPLIGQGRRKHVAAMDRRRLPAGSVLAVQAKSSHGNAWNRQINGASAKITWIDEG